MHLSAPSTHHIKADVIPMDHTDAIQIRFGGLCGWVCTVPAEEAPDFERQFHAALEVIAQRNASKFRSQHA